MRGEFGVGLCWGDGVQTMNGVWERCLADLRYQIDDAEFNQWFSLLRAEEQGQTLVVYTINEFFIKKINESYLGLLQTLAYKHSQGQIVSVVLQVAMLQSDIAVASEKPSKKKAGFGVVISDSDILVPTCTFDAFVKGKSNTLAYNACYDMAKRAEQSSYASIFLYGVSGVGKTHLMQAVAHRYQKSGRAVCYFEANGFMERLARAFAEKRIPQFMENVKQADLLIIDDVHLMPSKKKVATAGILLELYSDFVGRGKRVILASDRLPSQMVDFDPRFLSRFSEGLTVAIDPPEMDTRVHILEKKANSLNLTLPKDCAIFIAQNVSPDVRRLEGALNQVHATAQMMGLIVVDLPTVRQAIRGLMMARAQSINADTIKTMVAEYYGISVKDLVGKKRTRNIARPRQLAMALTREFTHDSFPDIGQSFGGRDHSTVIHACEKVAELITEDAIFAKDYQALSATLNISWC